MASTVDRSGKSDKGTEQAPYRAHVEKKENRRDRIDEWEYYTCFLYAQLRSEDVEYFRNRFQNWKVPQHAPQTLIPILNEIGKNGWELVHMEPVPFVMGSKQDFQPMDGEAAFWTSWYFAVFKRRNTES